MYTPRIIRSTAEFTSSYYNYSQTAITFGPDTGYRRLFKLSLIPGGVLAAYPDITVKITVGLQNAIRSGDSDPKFLISDGETGIGFEMREEGSIHCQGVQGNMGDTSSFLSRGGASYSAVSKSILPVENSLFLP